MKTWSVNSLEGWQPIVSQVLEVGKDFPVWLFDGQMGAGKTTLIRLLGQALGVEENISSPTFGIVNEYEAQAVPLIYHFDFYRLEDPEEALEIGWEDYLLDTAAYCWVEWPERIRPLWPNRYLWLSLELGKHPTARTLTLQTHE